MRSGPASKLTRRRAEADRALFIASGGLVGWQRELERRRAERNARTRERTRQAIEARRQAQQATLFGISETDGAQAWDS